MTIDERLERLAERHEALAQTVEVMAGLHRDNEVRLAQVMDSMNRLDSHDTRLDHLEGQ